MTTYNNITNNLSADADLELAEYGIIRDSAKKGIRKYGDSDSFFSVNYEGHGQGATITYGTPEEISEYGATMYMMAPDNNDSMNMLHRQKLTTPFVNMSESDLRKAISKILDNV